MDKLPAMINSLRDGSYNRGAMTALGGWSVKFFYRIMQNAKINEDDCGSKEGIVRKLTPDIKGNLQGYYYLDKGKTFPIDDDFINGNMDKLITMRSPMFCKTEGSGYCKKCLGNVNGANPTGLGALAAEVGSQFMLWRMGAMHGTSLKTARYNHLSSLS